MSEPTALDEERLARALGSAAVGKMLLLLVRTQSEGDRLAPGFAGDLARVIADAYENAEPVPVWDEEGPKVGQVITIAGSNVRAMWNGAYWERIA